MQYFSRKMCDLLSRKINGQNFVEQENCSFVENDETGPAILFILCRKTLKRLSLKLCSRRFFHFILGHGARFQHTCTGTRVCTNQERTLCKKLVRVQHLYNMKFLTPRYPTQKVRFFFESWEHQFFCKDWAQIICQGKVKRADIFKMKWRSK